MEIQGIITAESSCSNITGMPHRYLTVTIPTGWDEDHPSGCTSFDVPINNAKLPADIKLGDKVKITIEVIR